MATKNTDTEPIVVLRGVTKTYGRIHALEGVDMTVRAGTLFGFLGPNGAGKTTTIRILTGFVRPSAGIAQLFGLDSWRDSVRLKQHIGFLPDTSHVYEGMTGREFLDYLGRLRGFRRPPLQRELLERLGISVDSLSRKLKEYSHGMRQKVMLVQAMHHNPDLLIMDEPTEALDPLVRQELFGILQDFTSRSHTVFISSHVLSEVEDICHEVAIVRNGSVVSTGPVADLLANHTRMMWVEFREPPSDRLVIPGIDVISREGNVWQFAISGDINPVIRELASYNLKDLTVGRASLEELFLSYYRDETGRVG